MPGVAYRSHRLRNEPLQMAMVTVEALDTRGIPLIARYPGDIGVVASVAGQLDKMQFHYLSVAVTKGAVGAWRLACGVYGTKGCGLDTG